MNMDLKPTGEGADFDWRAGLRSLKLPILILNGRADLAVTPRQAQQLVDAAPHAKLVVFEKSGHFSFSEETAEVMKVIAKFLAPASR
jgi:pimeloyl-ACP methyl ester carboxylesterase